jgi:hypothetical protein
MRGVQYPRSNFLIDEELNPTNQLHQCQDNQAIGIPDFTVIPQFSVNDPPVGGNNT